jgi:arsenate reductase
MSRVIDRSWRVTDRFNPYSRRSEATLEVQIFGIKKSADTRKALRFFSERRIRTHFVDLMERPASLGELRRFAQKFGVMALVDRDSKRFDDLGLRYAQLSDDRWLEKLAEEPLLLRIPLVRNANQLVIGTNEATWKSWLER